MKTATGRGRRWVACGLLVSIALNSGCATMSNADKGALTGGALGAAAGGLIGGSRGKAGVGAVAGGALGAIAGAVTGSAIDRSEERTREQLAAANAAPPLALEDVARLAASGSSDDVIVNQIHSTGSVYNLSAEQIIWLQNQGVREPVVRAMQQTAYRPVRRVYTAAPVYVVPPPPPPPIGVGIGFRFGGRCH